MAKVRRLLNWVREILLREWDPLGVGENPHCFKEYDSYALTVCRHLIEGADKFKLAAYLGQVCAVGMGLSHTDSERDERVARRLLALRA